MFSILQTASSGDNIGQTVSGTSGWAARPLTAPSDAEGDSDIVDGVDMSRSYPEDDSASEDLYYWMHLRETSHVLYKFSTVDRA